MPWHWLVLAVLAYFGVGALAAIASGALALVHRVRFGPLPRPVIVLPDAERAPETADVDGARVEAPVAVAEDDP